MSAETAPPSESAPEFDRDNAEGSRMSFGDHLEELRTCLIRALLGFVAAGAIALLLGKQILNLVFAPLYAVQIANGLQPRLQALGPTDAFSAYLRISILAGLILAMPWILYQLWAFVATGLYVHERKFVKRLTFASAGLFAVGVAFLYFVVLPVVLQFFITFNRAFEASTFAPSALTQLLIGQTEPPPTSDPIVGLQVPLLPADPPDPAPGAVWVNTTTKRLVTAWGEGLWSAPLTPGAVAPAIESQFAIPAYISFVLVLALAFGIAFETPIVVVFLAWSDLVRTETMAGARRYIIMIIVLLAAVMTPPDVVSQLLLAIPMYGLFELGLFLARAIHKERSAAKE